MADNVHLVDHPLIQDKLTQMRDKATNSGTFRSLLESITSMMGYEVFRGLTLRQVEVETPLEKMNAGVVDGGKGVCIVPIMRAGMGFVNGLLELAPQAAVGYIGLERDHETLEPKEYYKKFPGNITSREMVVVVDPMLATGGSAIAAIDKVKEAGAKNIKFMALISAPEGIEALQQAHPDVEIFTAAIDRQLNDIGYILPGIGDAGDRIYGTEDNSTSGIGNPKP